MSGNYSATLVETYRKILSEKKDWLIGSIMALRERDTLPAITETIREGNSLMTVYIERIGSNTPDAGILYNIRLIDQKPTEILSDTDWVLAYDTVMYVPAGMGYLSKIDLQKHTLEERVFPLHIKTASSIEEINDLLLSSPNHINVLEKAQQKPKTHGLLII
ncbi:MAG: hypothetical protein ABIG84_04650 [archaeon]